MRAIVSIVRGAFDYTAEGSGLGVVSAVDRVGHSHLSSVREAIRLLMLGGDDRRFLSLTSVRAQ